MKNVTFFTLLPKTILGINRNAAKEFLEYDMMASLFAKNNNLNVVNGCGLSNLGDINMRNKYFSELKRKSTVLIISPNHVANAEILDCFIKKGVIFRVIEGDYLIKPKQIKEQWSAEVKAANGF